MDNKSTYDYREGMPMKVKITKKNQGKKNWNAQENKAAEIRNRRRVKYDMYSVYEEGYEERYDMEY